MFRSIALTVITIFCVLLLSFKPKKLKAPPGTVLLKENLFIDKFEVNNVGWREFEYWNLAIKRDTAFYWQMMQDTTVWGENSPYSEYYHNHPSYNNYPVVGISYDQAIEFCKWRTDRVNELFENEPGKNPFPGKRYLYRLPTIVEWELAAAGNLDVAGFPFGFKDTVGKKGLWKGAKLFNYRRDRYIEPGPSGITISPFAYTSPVNSFLPNGLRVYNMIGNVSEIVAEKGIAKGGNYSLPLEQCKIIEQQNYTRPAARLGFRCICEVVAE
jgi:formylglycine-generating enzyme required for sulfatase activity